ncbi:spindle pole body component 110 [Scaptodrosophila lebanonensis]|uniref:Spindle pole body component 110 n=1 Tax=Drosophila lebanonensis TaxID=7225 RepID=A0A6J2T2J7_DROLE|nr:spindle pole body component 110 [Scaptodrosophila lebanonensis]
MTQEAGTYGYASNDIQDVALGVERLINETNEDLKTFRAEQSTLRSQLSGVIEENKRLSSELGKYKKSMGSEPMDDVHSRLKCTSDALTKAMQQIDALRKERHCFQTLHECSQRTIEHMETELRNYRAHMPMGTTEESKLQVQVNQKYANAMKVLEGKLGVQQEELDTQSRLIKALHEHKQRSGEQIQQLQTKLKEKAYNGVIMDENKTKIQKLQKQVKEYEKSLNYTRSLLEESNKREAQAMRKVQDAISLSEAAMREKVEAEKRAESYKEESTQLASNIGSIMDEAAKRVDSEVAQLKAKLEEKNKALVVLRERFKNEMAHNKSVVQKLESHSNRLEFKYKEALKQNDKLANEVEVACKQLNDLERANISRCDEARQAKMKKHYESQMERYMLAHKEMKSRYKDALNDLTQKFESEIYRLQKDNAELLADNEMLKNGAAGDCTRAKSPKAK